ncbi:MAG: TonB-dependent receptor [Gammaproteobacteria bacterium]|nr:MAG: TonB-dependent receptor [Gammaproteobacteria bacterium]
MRTAKNPVRILLAGLISLAPCYFLQAQETSGVLEEVTVAAQKREEDLQSIAVSVSVISGNLLERMGVNNSTQLAEIIPNLTIRAERPGQSFPVIRGVGTPIEGLGIDQGVAIYVDGVQVDSPVANLVSTFDLERVEVLRGPQGTLYGRNAVGGVINLISRAPGEEFRGRARVGLGNFSFREIGFSAEGALVPGMLSGRISGVFQENSDGWYRNDAHQFIDERVADNGATENGTARTILVYQPAEHLDIRLSADYSKTDASGPAWQPLDDVNALAKASSLQGLVLPVYSEEDGDISGLAHNLDTINNTRLHGGGLTIYYSLNDRSELVSVTGYRKNEIEILEDLDGSPYRYLEVSSSGSARSFSQELRYQYSGDSLFGVVGLFYSDSEFQDQFSIDVAAEFIEAAGASQPAINQRGTDSEALAVFSQWEWDVSDRLRLILGARWTKSEKTSFRNEFLFTDLALSAALAGRERCFDLQPGLGPADQPDCLTTLSVPEQEDVALPPEITSSMGDGDWSRMTPRLGVQVRVHEGLMTYASFSQGYRDGGFEGVASNFLPFDEEILNAWEVGMKSDWLNGRLRVNGALFYYDYQDLQLEVSQLRENQLFKSVFNAGEAELTGGEIESTWLVSEMLRLSLNVGWLDTEITDLDRSDPSTDFGFVKIGNEFSRAPEWTVSFVPDFHFPLPRGSLTWRSEFNYKDSHFRDSENGGFADESDALVLTGANLADGLPPAEAAVAPGTLIDSERMDSRLICNTSLAYQSSNGRLEVAVWARNLFDEEYTVNRDFVNGLGYTYALYGAPRTYGAYVNYRF